MAIYIPTSVPGPSRWDVDEDPGKIRFIVPKFWEKNRMRSETQPYSTVVTVLQYGCVALRMRFFSQNFGTIKWILPGSSSPSHHEGPGTEVVYILEIHIIYACFSPRVDPRVFLSSMVTPNRAQRLHSLSVLDERNHLPVKCSPVSQNKILSKRPFSW